MTCRQAFEIDLAGFLEEPGAPAFGAFRDHYPRCASCAAEVRAWTELQLELGAGGAAAAHPEPELLVRYEEDRAALAPAERRAVEDHLAGCPTCREELRTLAAFEPEALGAPSVLGALAPPSAGEAPGTPSVPEAAGTRSVPEAAAPSLRADRLSHAWAALRRILWHPAFAYALAGALLVPALYQTLGPAELLVKDARRTKLATQDRPQAEPEETHTPSGASGVPQAKPEKTRPAWEASSVPPEATRPPSEASGVPSAETRLAARQETSALRSVPGSRADEAKESRRQSAEPPARTPMPSQKIVPRAVAPRRTTGFAAEGAAEAEAPGSALGLVTDEAKETEPQPTQPRTRTSKLLEQLGPESTAKRVRRYIDVDRLTKERGVEEAASREGTRSLSAPQEAPEPGTEQDGPLWLDAARDQVLALDSTKPVLLLTPLPPSLRSAQELEIRIIDAAGRRELVQRQPLRDPVEIRVPAGWLEPGEHRITLGTRGHPTTRYRLTVRLETGSRGPEPTGAQRR